MPVRNRAGVLGIFLRPTKDQELRVGTLIRDANGAVTFDVDEAYIGLGEKRPIISLSWHAATEKESVARLRNKYDKMSRGLGLPPYFDNLLPEGALLELVEKEFGTGAFDRFDVLARLGGDLPGAVVARREAGEPPTSAAAPVAGVADIPRKPISFSLAGVQLKFSMRDDKRRLTAPGVDEGGDLLLKLPSKDLPGLVEAEYTAMQLAKLAGVNTSETWLVKSDTIDGLPKHLLKSGEFSLAVRRFDRAPNGVRIHTEDFAQILGAIGDQKYFLANQDTLINVTRRFSADSFADAREALRRLVVDIMVGNGDGHLKNWSFLFPDGRHPGLSQAYDIVPTLTYLAKDTMALKLAGTSNPRIVTIARIRSLSKSLKLDAGTIEREVRETMERILDTWPAAVKDLPGPAPVVNAILGRWPDLALVADVRPVMVQGHDSTEGDDPPPLPGLK